MRNQVTPAGYNRAGIIFIILAVVFAVGMISNISKWENFCSDPVTVQATVLRNTSTYSRNGSTYTVYVSYEYNGIKVNDVALHSESPRHSPAKEGSQVPVRIDADHPEKMLRKPGIMDYVFGSLVFFFGVFGILMLRASKEADIY